MKWWNWFQQVPTYTSNNTGRSLGHCEVCGDHGVVCLNGQRFYCWDHYRDEMQRLQPRIGDAVCAKCGCATGGEVALVQGEEWCHPCADMLDDVGEGKET